MDHVSTQTLLYIIIGVAVAAWLIVRQLRAQPLNARMRLPLIFGIIGVIELVNYLGKHHATGTAVAALVGSLVVAAVFGAIRAATADPRRGSRLVMTLSTERVLRIGVSTGNRAQVGAIDRAGQSLE